MACHTFTIGHLFCGIGGGALGAAAARVAIGRHSTGFRTIGGVDCEPEVCADFESLLEAPALCADVARMTPADLRAAWGDDPPDMVLSSPPCQGYSALLSRRLANTAKYRRLNQLVLDGLMLLCSTWNQPPALIFVENVPRITSRGKQLLRRARQLLRAHGYLVTEDAYHDCGAVGGLAQHRRRWFLVARCPKRLRNFLYVPPVRRVRGCGEVLGGLPLPFGEEGGPLHRMPRISWLNWVRLALIPAGGDWRDLPGVLAEGQARRERHRRHMVVDWGQAAPTIGGSGSNGASAVADPRGRYLNNYRVLGWQEAARTIAGATRPGSGAPSVADPRIALGRTAAAADSFNGRPGLFGVLNWLHPAQAVTGTAQVSGSNTPAAVADPRPVDSASVDSIAVGAGIPADPRKPPDCIPIIIAADGTWHRPLTTLELAALQGFPTEIRGEPLSLAGASTTEWRRRVGNAIPPPAALAIAEQVLWTLLASMLGVSQLRIDQVWVQPASNLLGPGISD